ncbi:MAG: helix-turn-helix transcriptional regulator [Bacteroidetes bacterium]|nr:helix-turn-helix transcriptional regulator [Bacteroidota bacterium]
MIQLGQQIKNLRTANHLSQEDLAQKLFVSRQSISKYENGEATPDVEKLVQMAEIFEVSLDYLILGREPEKEVLVEQRGKMNAWEFLSEESKRPVENIEMFLFILCMAICILTIWILTMITK